MPPLTNSPLRRRVRRTQTQGTRASFVTKSFSRDDGTLYRPSIDTATGSFFCDCPDHLYRGSFCKHLRRAAGQLNWLPPATPTTPPTSPSAMPSVTSSRSRSRSRSREASPPPPLSPSPPLQVPPLEMESPIKRPFFDEHIQQILPAPPLARAQFADGGHDEPVWCLALLCANSEKGRPETQFQLVVPMIHRAGCLELACDVDRPYDRLVMNRR